MRGALGDPVVVFALLGVALWFAWTRIEPEPVEVVRIEAAALRLVEQSQEELLGRPLTDDERHDVREGYIEEEVLVREALRRGLQLSDYRVRKRLAQIMRGSLTELVDDPSVAQLEAYFRESIDDYTRPNATTFEQVVFQWGDDTSERTVGDAIEALQGGGDHEALGVVTRSGQTRVDLVGWYGAEFADRVESLAVGGWHGPIESLRGVHLVRVIERHPPVVPEFEQIESYLRQDWVMERTRELQQEGVDEIRARFHVEVVDER